MVNRTPNKKLSQTVIQLMFVSALEGIFPLAREG
jgi:hypothetical protein